MKKLQLNQGTPEWLEIRRSKIGASDTPTIMGDGYKGIAALWKEKKGYKESFSTQAMREGVDNEPKALLLANQNYGMDYEPLCALHDEKEWLMASFDGWDEKRSRHAEIKVPNSYEKFCKMADGEIEMKFKWQFQHQLAVNGLEEGDFLVYSKHKDQIHKIVMQRDEAMIQELLKACEQFYVDYIEGDNIPEEVYLERKDPALVSKIEDLLKIRAVMKKNKSEEEKIREEILAMTHETFCKCAGVKIFKQFRDGSIVWNKIPELSGKDERYLDQFRKPGTEYWTVR